MLSSATGGSKKLARYVGRLAQVVAVAVPLLATLDRFRRPFGEKFMFPNLGGSADLWLPYLGARALLAHLDPYGPLPQHLQEPTGWPPTYPPTMLALYVPFAWATGEDIELACQIFYWLNIAALGALSYFVWRLTLRLTAPRGAPGSTFLVAVIALSLNGLTMFAVDRGQSEIVSSALCWGALVLFLQKRHGWAMAAVTLAGAIKGYAVPVGVGLLLATRGRKQVLRGLAAATAVGLAVTVPVAKYLKQGFASMLTRTDYAYGAEWFNHSFKSTIHTVLNAELADAGRTWMLCLTALVFLGSLWRLFVATRRGTEQELALRLIAFAGAGLTFMVGLPAYSASYNYLLVLPALLLVSTQFGDLDEILKLHPAVAVPLGLVLVVALGLALRERWIGHPIPLAGIALVLFVGILGVVAIAPGRGSSAAPPRQT